MNRERAGLYSRRWIFGLSILWVCVSALPFLAGGVCAEEPPCGIPPPGKPKRIKGGEGVPPLPLPATPLRRSERKRDPAPPLLIGKIRWGRRDLDWKCPDGQIKRYGDWNLDPNDVHGLLERVTGALKTKYRAEEIDLPGFAFDPREVPVLFAAGARPFSPSADEAKLLGEYLLRGGFLFTVAHHGSREFTDSIHALAARRFPDRPLRLLPPDHPIYRAYRRIDRVHYTPGTTDRPDGAPYLEGVMIGCRVVLVHSPYDLNCTWDSDHLPEKYPGVRGEDAFTLGVNVLGYAIACYPLGQFYARWGLSELEDPDADRGDFVFAQIRHRGHHDPNPTAFAALLTLAMKETSIGAKLRRKVVALSDPELSGYPFLYLTGHGDFRLSDEERAALRRFILAGGFLLADSCCGNLGFDVAFRREIGAVLPEAGLRTIGADHSLLSSFYEIGDVQYTTAVRASFPELRGVFLEGIESGGALRVLYSRFDLGNGWEGEDHPFALGYERDDARRIGVNAIVYALTH